MGKLTQIILRQQTEETVVQMAVTLSDVFETKGLRGLVVWVPPAWTAADIGFIMTHGGAVNQLLRDATGAPVAITGIATAAAHPYIAPSAIWGLGGGAKARLASINVAGTGVLLPQAAARELKIFRLY